jgi:hypothetical protein
MTATAVAWTCSGRRWPWLGGDGSARALVEGTDFLRTSPEADALTVVLTSPVEGRYDFTVAGADHLGNVAAAGPPLGLTADASPPLLTVEAPADGAVVYGSLAVEAWAVDALLPGSVALGASLEDAGGASVDDVAMRLETTAVADGAATLTVSAHDGAANAQTVTRAVVVDNEPPRITVIEPAPEAWLRAQIAVTVAADDDGAGVARIEARLDDADGPVLALAESPDDAGYHLALVAEPGDHALWLRAVDRAGRRAEVAVPIAVDETPPRVGVSPEPGAAPTRELPIWTVQYDDDGVGVDLATSLQRLRVMSEAGELPTTVDVATHDAVTLAIGDAPSGVYRVEAVAVDRLGNSSDPVVSRWQVDREAPEIAFPSDAAEVWSGTVEVSWSAADVDEVATSWLSVEDATGAELPLADDGPPWGVEVDTLGLSDGPAQVMAAAADRAGNVANAARWVLVDNTAPTVVITAPAEGEHVPARLTLAALVEEGASGVARCEARDGDDVLLTQVVVAGGPTGAVPCELPVVLERGGARTLEVRAFDLAGLRGTATVAVVVDVEVPRAEVSPSGGVVTALPVVVFTVVDASDADAGADLKASAAAVSITRDGAPAGGWEVVADQDGARVVATPPAEAGEGTWRIALSPRDRVGNVGAEVAVSFALDTSPPEVAAIAPAGGAVIGGVFDAAVAVTDGGAVASVTATATDVGGGSVEVAMAGPPWRGPLDTRGLLDGPATLVLAATDAAGHVGTATVEVTLDNTAPVVAVTAPGPGRTVRAGFTLAATVDDAGAGVVAVEVRGGDDAGPVLGQALLPEPLHGGSVAVPVLSLDEGPVALVVRAIDAAGRVGTATRELFVDATAPSVTPLPAAGSTLGASLAFTLYLNDGGAPWVAGADLEATLATLAATRAAANYTSFTATAAPGRISVSLDEERNGGIDFRLRPMDALGNTGPQLTIRYVVDRRAPRVTYRSPGDGGTGVSPATTIQIGFDEPMDSASLSAALRVTADGAAVPGGVSWDAAARLLRFTPAYVLDPLAAVTVTLLHTATDLAGNPMASDEVFSFQIDTYRFRDVAAEVGLAGYRGGTGESGEDHGPGGTFADLTGDGYPDLVLGTDQNNPLHLYVNVPAPGTPAGRGFQRQPVLANRIMATTGVVAGDYDNDGDLDLYVTNFHQPNVLLKNGLAETGAPTFSDVTAETRPSGDDPNQVGLAVGLWPGHKELTLSMTAGWADVNRDGWLDLYVGNHNGHYPSPDYGPKPGERDVLYLNLGDGTFRDVTDEAHAPGWEASDGSHVTGVQEYSSTNAVVFADLNDDRWPDLIVTNKLRHSDDRDMIYLNLGEAADGTWLGFHAITYELDPVFGNTNGLAMGIGAGDVDRDGDIDFYVTDWAPYGVVPGPNELWLNQFVETGAVSFVVDQSCGGVYSWGVQIVDLDNDGRLDIHVVTNSGFTDLLYHQDASEVWLTGGWPDVASAWGVAQSANSRGDLAADLDRDGWMDLFVVNGGAASRLYRNYSARSLGPRRWLSVRLVGDPGWPGPHRSSRDAIGGRVYATADTDGDGVPERQLQEIVSGTSNAASTSSLEAEFGLGAATSVDLEIRWPSGRDTWLEGVPVDTHLVVYEADLAP